MMRIKTSLVAVALLLAGLSLKGEVLYWMVDDQAAEEFPFAYASVASSTGGYLPYVDDDGATVPGVYEFGRESVTGGEGVYVDVAGREEATFRVELFNATGTLLAYSDVWWSYADLLKNNAIVSPTHEKDRQTPWMGGAFTSAGAVPEPTSGLLMLLGLAGLALRRKNQGLKLRNIDELPIQDLL